MKILIYIISIMLLFQFCSPDDFPPIGKAQDRAEQIVGTWKLTSFLQIETAAREKAFPDFATVKDLTNIFPGHPYTDFSITFNDDGTFTSAVGQSYMDFLDSGTWEFDDNDFPSMIILKKGELVQNVEIGSWGDILMNKFQFAVNRLDTSIENPEESPVIIYEYNLIKQ